MYKQMHDEVYNKIDWGHIVKDGKLKVFPLEFKNKIINYI